MYSDLAEEPSHKRGAPGVVKTKRERVSSRREPSTWKALIPRAARRRYT